MKELIELTEMFNEPYDINRHEYTGKLKLDEYIREVFNDFPDDSNWEDHFKKVFTKDIVRFHGTVNDESEDISIWFVGTDGMNNSEKYEYLSNQFDTFIKKYVSITDQDIKKFKAFTTQNCVSPIAGHFFKMFKCQYLLINQTKTCHFTLYKNDCKKNLFLNDIH